LLALAPANGLTLERHSEVDVRTLVKLGLTAALALAPAAALADDEEAEGAEEETPINPYEIIEADPALETHGWIALSIGAAALIAGGVTGGVALHLDSELEGKCPKGQCPPAEHDRLDRRDALATSSTALLASGFAMAMVGLLLITVFASDEEDDGGEVALLPLAGPQLNGAALEWRF
jgi:hypothetical protein